MGAVDAVEWACVRWAITFKMTEQVEQQICIKFCVKLEHSSAETIWMTQKATAMGNWWLAALSQHAHTCITFSAEFFCETKNHPGDSAPLQPGFSTLWHLAFPQTKVTFEREGISDCWWDSGKYNGAADSNWENCVFFVFVSSINVSIFPVSYTHLTLPTNVSMCRSRWSPYH